MTPERVEWSVYVACRVVKDHQKELRFCAQCVPPALASTSDELDTLFICQRPDLFRSLSLDKPAPALPDSADVATASPPLVASAEGAAAAAGAKKPQSAAALLLSCFEPSVLRVPLRNVSDAPLRLSCAGESILFRVHIAARTVAEEGAEPAIRPDDGVIPEAAHPAADEAWPRSDVVMVPPHDSVDLVVTLNHAALQDRLKIQHVLKFRSVPCVLVACLNSDYVAFANHAFL
jgi:hypothetical protein